MLKTIYLSLLVLDGQIRNRLKTLQLNATYIVNSFSIFSVAVVIFVYFEINLYMKQKL
jgi:hypothetical protein